MVFNATVNNISVIYIFIYLCIYLLFVLLKNIFFRMGSNLQVQFLVTLYMT